MPRPGKPLVNRPTAVQAAISVIGAEGLEAFSMPRLAAEFGVTVPSLYHHFRDRDDVLLAVARYVAGTAVGTPDVTPGPDWPEYFVTLAVNFRRSFLVHANTATLLLRYRPRDLLPDGYEAAAEFLYRSQVPVALHIRVLDGLETLLIGDILCETINPTYASGAGFHGCELDSRPALSAAARVGNLDAEAMFEAKVRALLVGVARAGATALFI